MSGIYGRFNIYLIAIILIFPCALFAEDADELYREGKFADAEKAYKQGDMDNPKDIRYRYNRGCAAFQNSDYKGAAASFSSVVRRAKDRDDELTFRASYNLGNTAFSQEDYASAAQYYKMALAKKPDSAEAKYNLELSLVKLKQAEENKKNDKQCDKNNKDDKQQGEQDKNEQAQNKQDKSGDQKQNEQAKGEDQKGQDKQDLSGELSAANPMDENMSEEEKQAQAAAMLDKQKAEALLDNIKEDRAKIMQYQTPEDKRDTGSGKAW